SKATCSRECVRVCKVSVWSQLSGPLSPAALLPTPSPPLNEVGSKPSLVQPLPHPPRL
ncbi:hypothetical protein Pcinc_037026, partial [Petrolisthes cinctipes]